MQGRTITTLPAQSWRSRLCHRFRVQLAGARLCLGPWEASGAGLGTSPPRPIGDRHSPDGSRRVAARSGDLAGGGWGTPAFGTVCLVHRRRCLFCAGAMGGRAYHLFGMCLWIRQMADGIGSRTVRSLLRELTLPYCLIAAGLAWRQGRRREVLAWVAGFALYAIFLAFHAREVLARVTPADRVPGSWLQFGGVHLSAGNLPNECFPVCASGMGQRALLATFVAGPACLARAGRDSARAHGRHVRCRVQHRRPAVQQLLGVALYSASVLWNRARTPSP